MSERRNAPRAASSALRIVCSVLALVSVLPGGGRTQKANGPDANALVRQMVQTYHNATTIQETTEARIISNGNREIEQSNTIKYAKPDRILITSQDPMQGSFYLYADGKLLTLYSGKTKLFTRRNVESSVVRILTIASEAAQKSLRMESKQMLNPITFLMTKGMPREAKSYRYERQEVVEGRKTHRVSAQADPAWMRSIFPELESNVQFVPGKRSLTLWIDPQSHLLVKSAITLTWQFKVPASGATPARVSPGSLAFQEVHRGTRLNAELTDAEFRFTPPKGAIQIFPEGR